MTATDTSLATVIGDAAAALLPADEAWTVDEAPASPFPDGPTLAVRAAIGDHVAFVVVTAEMARRVQVGPPPAEGLLDGLEPTVSAMATVLGVGPVEPLVEIDPGLVDREVHPGATAAALLDGGAHLVTVIVVPPAEEVVDDAAPASFEPIVGGGATAGAPSGLEVLHDVQMSVTAELGRTRMPLRDILALVPGSVIELDRAASAPVDVVVNGTLIARGEVVVIDEEFGIRINEIVGYEPPRNGRSDEAAR